jgi:hypothetical protein
MGWMAKLLDRASQSGFRTPIPNFVSGIGTIRPFFSLCRIRATYINA